MFNSRILMLFTFCGFLLWMGSARAAAPNVVYIMADDLGIGDVKCFGGDRCQISTPHFDRIAREGMRFTDAHAPASHCIPTRVALMTGRYAWRFRTPKPSGPWGFLNPRMPPNSVTLGTLMDRAGYHTAYIGKWHLGTKMQTHDGKNQGPTNVDYSRPISAGPNDHGFHYSFILPGSLDMFPYVFVENDLFLGKVTAQKGWSAFNRVGPAAEDFEDHQVLETFCRQMETYVANRAADKQPRPFFLYLALTAPHTPTSPRREFQGKSKLGLYGDFVMETDDCVGRVLAALDKHGLAQSTLVIATSDHGAASYAGNIRKATPGQMRDLEKQGHYACGIYRGYKFSAYEGGLRVPFVARWPGVVPAGSSCDQLIGLNDLLATLADLTSKSLPPTAAVDSVSFLNLLKDPRSKGKRSSMILQSTRAFVIRDGKWKLALCPGSGCPGHQGNTPKEADAWAAAIAKFGRRPKTQADVLQSPFVQLFDLDEDPGESHNIAGKHPDIVKRMFGMLKTAVENGRTTTGPTQSNDVERIPLLSARARGYLEKP